VREWGAPGIVICAASLKYPGILASLHPLQFRCALIPNKKAWAEVDQQMFLDKALG